MVKTFLLQADHPVRYPDGRPLGEAFAEPHETYGSDPKSIPGPWFVYCEDSPEFMVTASWLRFIAGEMGERPSHLSDTC